AGGLRGGAGLAQPVAGSGDPSAVRLVLRLHPAGLPDRLSGRDPRRRRRAQPDRPVLAGGPDPVAVPRRRLDDRALRRRRRPFPMSEPRIFFSDVNERQGSFLRRTLVFGGLTALGIGALGARLGQLQVVEAGRYATLARNNQFNFRLVPPPRGRILDRNGDVVAGNRPSFRVLVMRAETRDLDETLDLLGRLLPDTVERRRSIIRDVNAAPRFVPVPVKSDLTWEEFAKVNLYEPELPGVMSDMNEARFYPHGGAFAHTVGYVAKVSAEDVQEIRETGAEPPPILFHPGFRIGRQG